MLVLTRKPGEAITIGADIRIVVLGVDRQQVKIGVTAPRDVAVDRQEIAVRKAAGMLPGEVA